MKELSNEKFIIKPQDNLSPTQVFDEGCAESRLEELTQLIMEKLVEKDLKQFAREHREKHEPVPPYPYNEIQIREIFYEKARAEAIRVLEQERKNVVKARENYIKNTLNHIIRQAKLLVFTADGKIGKIYRKKEPIVGSVPRDSPSFRDVEYFEDDCPAGRERYEQIVRLKGRLAEFNQYSAYMSPELQSLLAEANNLLNLEVVDYAKTEKETE